MLGEQAYAIHIFKGVAAAANLLVFAMTLWLGLTVFRREGRLRAFVLLTGFGLLLSSTELVETLLRGPVEAGMLLDIRLVLRLATYAVLYRFVMDAGGRRVRVGALALAAAGLSVAAVVLLSSPEWADTAVRLGVGLPSAALGAALLWRMASDDPPRSRAFLRTVALLLAAYSLGEAGVFPILQLAGLAPVAQTETLGVVGIVSRTTGSFYALAFALLIGVYLHAEVAAYPGAEHVRDRIYGIGVAGLVAAIVSVGLVETYLVSERTQEDLREEIGRHAEAGAHIMQVTEREWAGSEPSLANLEGHLRVILETTPGTAHTFVARVSRQGPEIMAATVREDLSRSDPVPCLEGGAELYETLVSGASAIDTEADEGMCVTVMTPLQVLPGGDILALGMELEQTEFEGRLTAIRSTGVGLTLLSALAVLAMGRLGATNRRSQERLAADEVRFRRMFESAPGPAALADPGTLKVREVNRAMVEWLGYGAEELRSKSLDELEGESAEPLGAVIDRAIEQGLTSSPFREVVGADGHVRRAEYAVSDVEMEDDRLVMVFARDTTAQRMLEDTLTSHAVMQRVVADVATDFVTVTPESLDRVLEEYLGRVGDYVQADRVSLFRASKRKEGAPFDVSHQWCASGCEPVDYMAAMARADDRCWLADRLVETETVTVVAREEASDAARPLHSAMQVSAMESFVVVPLSHGDEVLGFVGIDSMRGKFDWRDEEIGLLKTLADILSTGLARLATETELARLSQALRQSPLSVVITDSEGDIEWVNPRFEQFNGYASEEVLGQNPRILQSGLTDRSVYEDLWKAILSGAEWRGELANRRKDGTLWWAGVTISALHDAKDRVVAFVGVQQDVTANREVQATLQIAKSAAEDANRAKSEFLSTMSHEIRTPMNAIIGMSELLAETELDDDQGRYVTTLASAGEALLDLIDDVLDLSKIEAGRVDLDTAPFRPAQLAQEVAEVVAVRVREKPVELLVHVADDVPETLSGDRHRLRQVLLNLLGNAVKFTREGHVLVDVGVDTTYDMADRVRLRFEVQDTGIGIARENQSHIFDAFAQEDASTTREYGGTGLGLAISKQLIELMGGNIGLRSRPGKGSTFAFTAVFDLTGETGESAEAASPDIAGVRILVVDDNPVNRMIVKDYLQSTGITIDEVTSGEEALEVMRTGERVYDVVLMDVRMPGIDGFEASRVIREERLAGDPAIVILTSEDSVGDRARVEGLGLEGRLLKPVRRRALIEAVAKAVGVARKRQGVASSPAQAPPKAAEKAVAAGGDEKPLRILLVEDSADNRFLIQAFLGDGPHRLDLAENGEEAVQAYERAGESGYDLVFMDMQMPVMDGYEATRSIRAMEEERGWSRTPVTALTAYALEEEMQKSLAAGCDAHLTKPIRKARLLEAIAEHSRG